MPDYVVTVEVRGTVGVVVTAENEDDACRRARHLAERGGIAPGALEAEALAVKRVLP